MTRYLLTILFVMIFVITKAQTEIPDPGLEQKPDSVNTKLPTFIAIEKKASFPGGTDMLFSFIRRNLQYPKDSQKKGIQGDVIISFEVEQDGRLNNIAVQKGLAADLDKEALRVIKKSPVWSPAIQNGRAVKMHFTVPVTFKLN